MRGSIFTDSETKAISQPVLQSFFEVRIHLLEPKVLVGCEEYV